MIVRLERFNLGPDGTFGWMTLEPKLAVGRLYTVEDDWLDNKPRISCIPVGNYKLHRTIFHKHGYETFEVMNVPGRSRILIHPANTEEDIEGCIGVGMRMGKLWIEKDEDTKKYNVLKTAVVESKKAFNLFMESMTGFDEVDFHVTWRLQ
jgi:hypothetical protein